MTTAPVPPNPNLVWIEKIVSVPSEYDGIFYPQVARNARVQKGAKIGVVRDYWYRTVAEITAPEAGMVMFVRALPSLKKGDTIVNIGVIKPGG
jgi:predicted deacylase